MGDGAATAGTDAPPATGTSPTPPAQSGRDPQLQQALDSAAAGARKETTEKLTAEFNAKLEAQAKELEALKTASLSADEKKLADAVKAKETELKAAHAAELRTLNAKLALAGKVHDKALDFAASLIPGDTPADQMATKVEAILKEHPYLASTSANVPGIPPGGPPPSGDGEKWGPQRVQAALAANKLNWAEVDAAKAAGRWDDSK